MKKTCILLSVLVVSIIAFEPSRVYAASAGWERYKDTISEVYFEYFPIVPYDPTYPTAAEEFALKFYVWQYDWWEIEARHWVPLGFNVSVYYRDDTCGSSNYVTWKRWFPTSTDQSGLQVSWSLSGAWGPLTLGASISTPSCYYINTDYTKYDSTGPDGKTYLHVAALDYGMWAFYWSGSTYTEGAGSLGIPNDLAQPRQGHHSLVWAHVDMRWVGLNPFDFATPRIDLHTAADFIFGDDIPGDTDCWLTVEQGHTSFSKPPTDGGGCPTLFVWNGTDYADEGVLNIHAESDITIAHMIQNELALEDGAYKIQLRELDEFTSHIDQVGLYAIDNQGKSYLCPLKYAHHNELGNVKQTLLLDDNNRVVLKPTETVDLRFGQLNFEPSYFVFEINGYNMKVP